MAEFNHDIKGIIYFKKYCCLQIFQQFVLDQYSFVDAIEHEEHQTFDVWLQWDPLIVCDDIDYS